MEIKKYIISTLCVALCCLSASAQSAKEVLDKTAAAVSNKSGVTCSFTLKGGQMNENGTINIKGRKFQVTVPDVTVWFDGKTQWTYVKKNDEVNVANPSEAEIQNINPYNFIYMYKDGYTYTMEKKNGSFEVHLKAKGNKGLWYFVSHEYEADRKVYFVDHEYQADLKIYFVNHEYQAGWRNR